MSVDRSRDVGASSDPTPLNDREIKQLQRMLSDPFAFPPELWNWIKTRIETDPPAITWDTIIGFQAAVVRSAGGGWMTGDTKVSAQPTTHDDPGGGTWYIADGSAIPGTETDLIALLGPNLPDARGRMLTMKGTHADIDAIGDSDGYAIGLRRPAHKHNVNDPGHVHTFVQPKPVVNAFGAGGSAAVNDREGQNTGGNTTGITVGPQTGNEPVDFPAYIVPGNLFYHS